MVAIYAYGKQAALESEMTGTVLQMMDAPTNKSGISHKDIIWVCWSMLLPCFFN